MNRDLQCHRWTPNCISPFVTCSDNVSYFERVVRVALDYCEHLWVDGSGDGREAVWDLIY